MKLFSGSSVVMRHCRAWPLSGCRPARGTPALRRADARALGDADLRLDDVEPGDALGDRVLDLDARIDLDEIELAAVGILQEFDRAGADDSRPARPIFSAASQSSCALRLVEKAAGARSTTFWLRRCTCSRARTRCTRLPCVVAEDLHFDVARAPDQLLEIDLVLAEGGFRLAPALPPRSSMQLAARPRSTRMPRPPPPQLAFSITGIADRVGHAS